MNFPAHVSIYRVTIPALLGHLINGRTLTVAVKMTIYRSEWPIHVLAIDCGSS